MPIHRVLRVIRSNRSPVSSADRIGYATGLPVGLTLGATLTNYLKAQPSLVALYPFDESSGNLINHAPATLGSLDGVVTSAIQGVATTLAKVPLAYTFDGVDDKVTIGNDASLAGLTNQTWGLLCKFDNTGEGGVGRVFAWGNTSVFLRTEGVDRYRFSIVYSGTNLLAQSAVNTIEIGNWAWVFVGVDAATKRGKIYQGIGGVLSEFALTADTAGTGTLTAPASELVLGNTSNSLSTMDGDMAYEFVLDVPPDTVEDVMQRVVTLSGV